MAESKEKEEEDKFDRALALLIFRKGREANEVLEKAKRFGFNTKDLESLRKGLALEVGEAALTYSQKGN